MSAQELFNLGQIPVSVDGIELDIQSALVSIRHDDRADIALRANYPDNWKIQGGSVRQTKVELGGGNVDIGGSVSDNDEVCVSVEGKKVTDSQDSNSQSSASNVPDKLEILVPKSYRGGLSNRANKRRLSYYIFFVYELSAGFGYSSRTLSMDEPLESIKALKEAHGALLEELKRTFSDCTAVVIQSWQRLPADDQ